MMLEGVTRELKKNVMIGQSLLLKRARSEKFFAFPNCILLTCKYSLAYAFVMDVLFKALADPTRRKILDELSERDGQTLFELCSRLLLRHQIASTRQAISQHLAILEAANLITIERQGRYKFHYINISPLRAIQQRWVEKKKEDA
jgi:DNA-binding transcriptional ArsR family regulator